MSKKSPLLVDIGQGLSILAGLPTIESWDSGSRPKEPKKGTFGYNSQTNNLEYWNGSDWFAAPMTEA